MPRFSPLILPQLPSHAVVTLLSVCHSFIDASYLSSDADLPQPQKSSRTSEWPIRLLEHIAQCWPPVSTRAGPTFCILLTGLNHTAPQLFLTWIIFTVSERVNSVSYLLCFTLFLTHRVEFALILHAVAHSIDKY